MKDIYLLFTLAIIVPTFVFSQTAYVQYHQYQADTSLNVCSCSDGQNGLITNFGYSDLSDMYPHVGAFSNTNWNSPNCGKCMSVSYEGKTVYFTVVDGRSSPPAGQDVAFNLSQADYTYLFGDQGIYYGNMTAEWSEEDPCKCKGNKFCVAPPQPAPEPAPELVPLPDDVPQILPKPDIKDEDLPEPNSYSIPSEVMPETITDFFDIPKDEDVPKEPVENVPELPKEPEVKKEEKQCPCQIHPYDLTFVAYYSETQNFNKETQVDELTCSSILEERDLNEMYPYVSAHSLSSRNKLGCGKCLKLTHKGNVVYVTVVNLNKELPQQHQILDAHISIPPETYQELIGTSFEHDNHSVGIYSEADPCKCQGNRNCNKNKHHHKHRLIQKRQEVIQA